MSHLSRDGSLLPQRSVRFRESTVSMLSRSSTLSGEWAGGAGSLCACHCHTDAEAQGGHGVWVRGHIPVAFGVGAGKRGTSAAIEELRHGSRKASIAMGNVMRQLQDAAGGTSEPAAPPG